MLKQEGVFLINRRPGRMLSYRQVKVGKYYFFARKLNADNNYSVICNFIARVDVKKTISTSMVVTLQVTLLYSDGTFKEQLIDSCSAIFPEALVPLSKKKVAEFKRQAAKNIKKKIAEF